MYENIQQWVQGYGEWFYLITFLWAFIEGETFLIFAGFFVSQGFLNLPELILCAGLGTTFGDFAFFLIGRYYGKKLIAKMPKLAKGQAKVVAWLEKHDVGFILTYRYVYGLRNVSAIAIGTSRISWQRYFFLNMCGAFIWAVSFACGGYLFGHLLVQEGEDPINAMMIGVLIIFSAVMIVRFLQNRRNAREEVEKNDSPPAKPE